MHLSKERKKCKNLRRRNKQNEKRKWHRLENNPKARISRKKKR